MQHVLTAMSRGDDLSGFFRAATQRWTELRERTQTADAKQLVDMIGTQEMWFETNRGGRGIGSEIMVITAIMQYYSNDVGFNNNLAAASRVFNGLRRSMGSDNLLMAATCVASIFPELEA